MNNNKEQFSEIVTRAIAFNRISHAYLVEINNYDDDFEIVCSFIKKILCPKHSQTPLEEDCHSCNICHLIDSNNYPDLKIIEPDGQWIKKNQLLSLQNDYQNKSMLGGKRIYIIKEADRLNMSSANTILKFLEEPAEDVIAILLTSNRYQILETILSRCQILTLKDSYFSESFSDEVCLFLEYIEKKAELFIQYSAILESIMPDKVVAKQRLGELENLFIYYLNNESSSEKSSIKSETINLLKRLGNKQIIKYISIIEEEIKKLEYNVNYKLWLDAFFAKIIGGEIYDRCNSN